MPPWHEQDEFWAHDKPRATVTARMTPGAPPAHDRCLALPARVATGTCERPKPHHTPLQRSRNQEVAGSAAALPLDGNPESMTSPHGLAGVVVYTHDWGMAVGEAAHLPPPERDPAIL